MRQGEQDAADRLFAPVSIESFVDAQWGRLPLYVHGPSNKFADLYSLSSFQSQMAGDFNPGKAERRPAPLLKAVHNRSGGGAIFHVPANMAMGLFDAGMTLCASNVELNDIRLSALVAAVRRRLRFTGQMEVNSYYSPDGEGFSWHYDGQHVFIIQIDGSKRWEFSEAPGVDWPPINIPLSSLIEPGNREAAATLGMKTTLPSELAVIEETLMPGDMLYLPPGTWHRAFACSHSFGLTLTLHPLSLAQIVHAVVAVLVLTKHEWRRDLHDGCFDPSSELAPDREQSLKTALDTLRSQLAEMSPNDFLRMFNEVQQVPLLKRMVQQAN
jgi:ribosomal protein L16 Arg81 hydroxylase